MTFSLFLSIFCIIDIIVLLKNKEAYTMGFTKKLKDFIAPMDEDELLEITEEDEEEDDLVNEYEKPQNQRVSKLPQDTKMVLFEPRAYAEVEEIGSHLKEKRAAVVNLHRLQSSAAQRTIDFLSGVIFAVDGSIQKIGPKVILCTPRNIGVAGSISLDDTTDVQQ